MITVLVQHLVEKVFELVDLESGEALLARKLGLTLRDVITVPAVDEGAPYVLRPRRFLQIKN